MAATSVDLGPVTPVRPAGDPWWRGRDRRGRARLRLPVAYSLALVSGLGLWLSFPPIALRLSFPLIGVSLPPIGLWWLAPLCVAGLGAAVHRQRHWAGFGLGTVAGWALFVPLLDWTGTQVGAWPWLLLATLQAVFVGMLGAFSAGGSRVFDRWRWTWPLGTAALWVGMEAVRDRVPFGGFPWGRLAFAQADSPLLAFAWLGGAPLVTFVTALSGGLLLCAVWRWRHIGWGRAGAFVTASVLLVLAGLVVPSSAPEGRTVVVAIVQGNVPRLGLDFNAQRLQVLNNHAQATIDLAGRVARGEEPQPDLVIWPENSSDIDPVRNLDAKAIIDNAAAVIKAPILVGALVKGPDGRSRNSGLVVYAGQEPRVGYVKRNLVPFVEQVPFRDLVEKITDKVKIAGNFAAGTEPGVVDIGGVKVGDVICYEIAFDDVVRETVDTGAELIAVQTNNATFNNAEAQQQLAMVRLRAVEHGRSALMASTVGVSAYVDADGTVHEATEFNTQAAMSRKVRLGDGVTPAHLLGMLPELLIAAGAAAIPVAAIALRRRRVNTSA